MILLVPQNRVCPNKATKFPITNYNPALWFKADRADYTLISIDGFIVNGNNAVNGVFKKLEYNAEAENEDITLEDVTKLISEDEIKLISRFSTFLQCHFFIFVWPENYPVGYNTVLPLIHSFKISLNDNQIQVDRHRKINLNDLERGINMLRGFSFKCVKDLKSASSNVECYLANNTTNPWPGDIDALLYNNINQRFEAIIEFKTHNIDSPVENESIGKYGQEDWRRFNVLFDLIDNFDKTMSYRPKLFFIVWGTKADSPNHANIKIDLIERNNVVNTTLFPRPSYNVFSQDLFECLINQIAGNQTEDISISL